MILVHIKTRLDLLGIQTFRWDQRLGRQYSNLNRHVSTQEKQSQRQYIVPHQAWCYRDGHTIFVLGSDGIYNLLVYSIIQYYVFSTITNDTD